MERSRSGQWRSKFVVATIVAVSLFPALVLATSIQVSPSRLDFNVGGKPVSQTIVVANPSDEVLYFQVSADSFQTDIDIYPRSFTLEAGGSKKVQVTVKPNHILGVGSTNLSVLSQPITSSQVQINTGAKIPITITHTSPNRIDPKYIYIGIGALLILFLTIARSILRMMRMRRSNL